MAEKGQAKGVRLLGENVRLTASLGSLVRRLDDDGTFPADTVVQTSAGRLGLPARRDSVDAEQLVAMLETAVRRVVREELDARGIVTPGPLPRTLPLTDPAERDYRE